MNQELLDLAIDFTLEEEGGWSNVKGDTGGPTNWGITLGLMQGLGKDYDLDGDGDVDAQDLRLLTKDEARHIYSTKFDFMDSLGDCDPRIKIKHFDIGVNAGPGTANHIIQRAVNMALGNFLIVDGRIGPKTQKGISCIKPENLLLAIAQRQLDHYKECVEHDPVKAKFMPGWTKRAARIPEVA